MRHPGIEVILVDQRAKTGRSAVHHRLVMVENARHGSRTAVAMQIDRADEEPVNVFLALAVAALDDLLLLHGIILSAVSSAIAARQLMPPSAMMVRPVIQPASGDARNRTIPAISSG